MLRITSLIFALLVSWSACAQVPLTGAGKGAPGGALPSYSFAGSGTFSGASTAATFPIDIGPASATRYIVVGSSVTSTDTYTVTVNSIPLIQDIAVTPSNSAYIFSGLVAVGSGVQNVVLSCISCAFQTRDVFVWILNNLNTNLAKHTGSGNGTTASINVTSGDFLFSVNHGGANFNGSTETPAENLTVGSSAAADWTVISTNASFSAIASASGPTAAATYH